MEFYQFGILFLSLVIQASCYIRVCYYTNWSQHRPEGGRFTPADIDPYLCTHIIFAFARIDGLRLGPFEDNDEPTDWSPGLYEQVTSLKEINPDLKVILAVGGWNAGSHIFANMVTNDASRATFIQSAIVYLRERNFDGLDIDWEYPARRRGRPRAQTNLTVLLSDMRAAFEREAQSGGREQLLLTAAVPTSKRFIQSGYDVARITRLLDFINVMTYDFHGSWESKTGHNSPLFPRSTEIGDDAVLNVEAAINYWLDMGATRDKLVVGIPTYGRSFTLMNDNDTGMGAPDVEHGPAGHYTKEDGFMSYYEICNLLNEGATRYWHQEHKVPYLVNGTTWVGYDDKDSIHEKVAWVKKRQLAGTVVWSLDLDDFAGEFCNEGVYPLLTTIKFEFDNITPEKRVVSVKTHDFIATDLETISHASGAIQPSTSTVTGTEGSGLFSNPNDPITVLKENNEARIVTGGTTIPSGNVVASLGGTIQTGNTILSGNTVDDRVTAPNSATETAATMDTTASSSSSNGAMIDFSKPSNAHSAPTHGTWQHANTKTTLVIDADARTAGNAGHMSLPTQETQQPSTSTVTGTEGSGLFSNPNDPITVLKENNEAMIVTGGSTIPSGNVVASLGGTIQAGNTLLSGNTVDDRVTAPSSATESAATMDTTASSSSSNGAMIDFSKPSNAHSAPTHGTWQHANTKTTLVIDSDARTAGNGGHISLPTQETQQGSGVLPDAGDGIFLLLPIRQHLTDINNKGRADAPSSMLGKSQPATNDGSSARTEWLNTDLKATVTNESSKTVTDSHTELPLANLENADPSAPVRVLDMYKSSTFSIKSISENNKRIIEIPNANKGRRINNNVKEKNELNIIVDKQNPDSVAKSAHSTETSIPSTIDPHTASINTDTVTGAILPMARQHIDLRNGVTGEAPLSSGTQLFSSNVADININPSNNEKAIAHPNVNGVLDIFHSTDHRALDRNPSSVSPHPTGSMERMQTVLEQTDGKVSSSKSDLTDLNLPKAAAQEQVGTAGQIHQKDITTTSSITGKNMNSVGIPSSSKTITFGKLTVQPNIFQPIINTDMIIVRNGKTSNQAKMIKPGYMLNSDKHQQLEIISQTPGYVLNTNEVSAVDNARSMSTVDNARSDVIEPSLFESQTEFTAVPIQSDTSRKNMVNTKNIPMKTGVKFSQIKADTNRGMGKTLIEKPQYRLENRRPKIDQFEGSSFVLTNTLDGSNAVNDVMTQKKARTNVFSSDTRRNQPTFRRSDKTTQSRYTHAFNTRKTSSLDPLHSSLELGPQGPDPTGEKCKIWNVICLDHIFDMFFHANDWHVTGEWHRPRNWLPRRWSRLGAWLRWNRQQLLAGNDPAADNTI